MGKIAEWIRNHEILTLVLILLLISGGINLVIDFCDNRYEKFYPNTYSYEVALEEFERICGDYKVGEENEYESEYYKFYDNKGEAINDFMSLVCVFDGLYANGKVRHWYLMGNERIYQCCDKNRNLIAVRLLKHKRMGINWEPEYELNFYVEKQ